MHRMKLIPSIATLALAEIVYNRAKATCDFAHYTGILTLNALARLAVSTDDSEERARRLDEARRAYQPFIEGRALFSSSCNFSNYRCGGNGAAYLWWKGELPEASEKSFLPYIEELIGQAPRDRKGILCHRGDPESEKIWIDTAFAVTPFLLYCGLAFERDDWISQAWKETRLLIEALLVPETGLLNQAINFDGPGHRSGDHWSRGNGWAVHAMAALVEDMPGDHPDRPGVEAVFVSLVDAWLKFQDPESGLWHQEMTAPESYLETSGSGLILHAIGVGLARGLFGDAHRMAFEHGLSNYLSYIAIDGSVHNTCVGCLSPNGGAREEYIKHPHRLNDCHAFGPAIFALTQAHLLGIQSIDLLK